MKANGIEQRHQAEQQPTSRSIPNVPCLKRHEINGNYYAVKKILGKIKRHSLRSESGMPLWTESPSSETARVAKGLEVRQRRALNL